MSLRGDKWLFQGHSAKRMCSQKQTLGLRLRTQCSSLSSKEESSLSQCPYFILAFSFLYGFICSQVISFPTLLWVCVCVLSLHTPHPLTFFPLPPFAISYLLQGPVTWLQEEAVLLSCSLHSRTSLRSWHWPPPGNGKHPRDLVSFNLQNNLMR